MINIFFICNQKDYQKKNQSLFKLIIFKKIHSDFPILKIKCMNKKRIYFDNVSTTFKTNSVIKAINKYYLKDNSNSRRGDYEFCYKVR